jgi:hypothetical protein
MNCGNEMTIKTGIIVLFFICLNFTFCTSAGKTQATDEKKNGSLDSSKAAVIKLFPPSYEVPKPDGNFITEVLKIKNTGNDTLIINKVEGSCYCASSTVLNSRLAPQEEGKIMLYINLKGLYDDKNIVQYTIYSNAKNSPTGLDLTILPAIKDSTNTKEKNK